MSITVRHFEPGATWTFVHSSGKRTGYVYENQMQPSQAAPDGKGYGLSATHRLLNPETGGYAMVSEKWMREGPVGSRSHWLAEEAA